MVAKLELTVSIYPTVWCVVLKDHGLPVGEVVESVWSTKTLAEAKAFELNDQGGPQWEVVTTKVRIGEME